MLMSPHGGSARLPLVFLWGNEVALAVRMAIWRRWALWTLLVLFSTMKLHGAAPTASVSFEGSREDVGNNNCSDSAVRANRGASGVDLPGGMKAPGGFCNGRAVADSTGQGLGIPPVAVILDPITKGEAILHGVNYASGGSRIMDSMRINFVNSITMRQQILQLWGPAVGAALFRNSIYSVSVGSNDFLKNYLMALVIIGARKFILLNVGPLRCIPYSMALDSTRHGECVQSDNTLVVIFSAALKALVNEFNGRYTNTKFVMANTYNVVSQMINNPFGFGFVTADQACCGVPVGLYLVFTPCFPGAHYCSNRKNHLLWDP